jgi:hypothetical protein
MKLPEPAKHIVLCEVGVGKTLDRASDGPIEMRGQRLRANGFRRHAVYAGVRAADTEAVSPIRDPKLNHGGRAAWSLLYGPGEGRQAHVLASIAVEVARVKPTLECAPERGPFAIQDREPHGISIAALGNAGLSEIP